MLWRSVGLVFGLTNCTVEYVATLARRSYACASVAELYKQAYRACDTLAYCPWPCILNWCVAEGRARNRV